MEPKMNAVAFFGACALAGMALATIGCDKKEPKVERAPPSAAAKQVFAERCAACHGPTGRGDGPASAALNPKPRNYTDSAWQASVTDEQIKRTITLGGAAVGKSPIMPASPDLDGKPEVVDGLVKIIRKFGS